MIGSAIGLKVMEDVPYIAGMDRFIKGVDEQSSGYLKDLGAATASNGAVGLYHMESCPTPETGFDMGSQNEPDGLRESTP